jgi:hypothetical protein
VPVVTAPLTISFDSLLFLENSHLVSKYSTSNTWSSVQVMTYYHLKLDMIKSITIFGKDNFYQKYNFNVPVVVQGNIETRERLALFGFVSRNYWSGLACKMYDV